MRSGAFGGHSVNACIWLHERHAREAASKVQLHDLLLWAFVDSSDIGLDLVLFDHWTPELHLVRQKLALHVRAADLYCDLHRLDAALDRRFAQRLRKRIAETIDNVARRAPGGERAPPGVGLKTEEAALDHGRNVRQTRNAGRAGLSQPVQLAPAHWGCDRCGTANRKVDMPRQRVVHKRATAAIR